MNEVKQIVGTLEKKEEGDGFITAVVNVGTKFPLKLKAWTKVYGTDIPADILAELEGVKPGMKVSATFAEKPYKNRQGAEVIGRNLLSIAIATDATPVQPPAPSANIPHPAPKPDGQKAGYPEDEAKSRRIGMMSSYNNAVSLYAPILTSDYAKNGIAALSADELDRHLKNITAIAEGLFDGLTASTEAVK